MYKGIAMCFMFVLLVGCSTSHKQRLVYQTGENLSGKTLVTYSDQSPKFMAGKKSDSVGVGLFGFLGVAAAMAAAGKRGEKLVKEHEIVDPSKELVDSLGKKFADKYGLSHQSSQSDTTAEGSSDLLLEINTHNWGIRPMGGFKPRYQVMYEVQLKLSNIRTEELLADSKCYFFSNRKNKKAMPNYDGLVANESEHIKEKLLEGKIECEEFFSTSLNL